MVVPVRSAKHLLLTSAVLLALGSLPAHAQLTPQAIPDMPGTFFAYYGHQLNVPAPGVLANDNPNGNSVMEAEPQTTSTMPLCCGWIGGQPFELRADGSFTYTPPATGSNTVPDGFRYRVTNGVDFSGLADVHIIVRNNAVPVAGFSFAPGQPFARQVVQFTDSSTDADTGLSPADPANRVKSWFWNFGDGHISYQQSPTHYFDTPGRYTVQLTVSDGLQSSAVFLREVTVQQAPRNPSSGGRAPVADAGEDRVVEELAIVQLEGKGSGESPLLYTWQQTAGPYVEVSNVNAPNPTFAAPYLADGKPVTLQFRLIVSHYDLDSVPDIVNITVRTPDRAPVVTITSPASIVSGSTVELNGTKSADPEKKPLAFRWTQVGGPIVPLSGADGPVATFIAPPYRDNLPPLVFRLEASDGRFTGTGEATLGLAPPTVLKGNTTFSVTRVGTQPGNITFSAQGTNGTEYVWDFGDGSPGALGPNATHVYARSGTFRVKLVATGPHGVDTHIQELVVDLKSVAGNRTGDGTATTTPPIIPVGSAGAFPWVPTALVAAAVAVAAVGMFVVVRALRRHK
jgi:PKD repeat protein